LPAPERPMKMIVCLFIGALYQQKKKSPTLKLSELDAVHRIEGQILDAIRGS
jgi:hypothetical protein